MNSLLQELHLLLMISAYQIYTEESATKNIPNFSDGQNTVVCTVKPYILKSQRVMHLKKEETIVILAKFLHRDSLLASKL